MKEEPNNVNSEDQNLLAEILTRLDRLESLIFLTQAENFEGNEPFEGDDLNTLSEGGRLESSADIQSLDASVVARLAARSQAERLEKFIDNLGLQFFNGD